MGAAAYAPWIIMIFAFMFLFASLKWIFSRSSTGFLGTEAPSPAEQLSQGITDSLNTMLGASKPTNPLTAAINSRIFSQV